MIANEHVDRPRRFSPTDRRTLSLTVQWADGGQPTTAPATLLDISAGGVKLSLASHLKLHQAISLAIVCPELKLDLTVPAKVCWLRPGNDDRWSAGCAFVPELSAEALEILFASGLIERRIFPRHSTHLATSAQWELDPARFDIVVLDVSTGGVSIRSPQPGKIGVRLIVLVPDGEGGEAPIALRCQWQIAADDGFLVGCAYVNVEGHSLMHAALTRSASPPVRSTAKRPRWRRRAFWAAGSIALGWAVWAFGQAPLGAMIARLWAQ